MFDGLGEDWPKHSCDAEAEINHEWVEKLRGSNRARLLNDYSILVSLDLTNSDDVEIATGLLSEANCDGIVGGSAGLVILSGAVTEGEVNCWVGEGRWVGEAWLDFGNTADSPKVFSSISAVHRWMKKANKGRDSDKKSQRNHIAFWLYGGVDFDTFKKYCVLTGKGLVLLARRTRNDKNTVTCSLCDNQISIRHFEDHVRKRHFS